MPEDILDRLNQYLKKRGLRRTRQREAIVEQIFSSDEHFSPDELLVRLKKNGIHSSRATLYRTLILLREAGLLYEIDLGDGRTTYDPNFHDKPSHNHLVCVDCGKVLEFEDEHLEVLNECLSRRLGFRPVKNSLRIEATCDRLRATGSCPNHLAARLHGHRLPN